MAKLLLDKVPIETNPGSKIDDLDCVKDRRPVLDPEAKRSSDVSVTVRPRASNRVEQETVESGNEDIGSSMQSIGPNLLHSNTVSDQQRTIVFPSDLLHVVAASDHSIKRRKLNGIPRGFE